MKLRTSIFCLCLACPAFLSPVRAQGVAAPVVPEARTDKNSQVAHQLLLKKAKRGGIDLYFEGDSITRRWGATDYPTFLANWRKNFFGWNAADFGWGGDRIQNILWRVQNGELDGVNPKVIVILAGTNNIGKGPPAEGKVGEIIQGLEDLIGLCRQKAPGATVVVTAIFPRNDNMAALPVIDRANEALAKLADGKSVRFLNVNDRLADKNGVWFEGMTLDKLHPSLAGYQVWADGLRPILSELLGPPSATDHAPPPTGDPSAEVTAGR